ncbi:max-binding protein MNT isoform X2 [Electrophorus electricus]|uniref:max-binding protein MNT isoform X2 n=1 Tax=Electrophorus electricus TaxID=8005 RepID=UPI0015CFEBB3|nr:max-binding protein MNT isoform X2 [Electrophorus electricus]
MSIETLLEAAKFLELQALQQQKTREENELQERLRLEQEAGKRRAEVASYVHRARASHVAPAEGSAPAHRHTSAPAPPPPLPAHSIPIAVIPVPVVSSNPSPMPTAPAEALSSQPDACLTPPRKDAHSSPAHHALLQGALLSNQAKMSPTSLSQLSGAQPLQSYPGSVVTASQHALLPQAGPPPAQPSPGTKTNPLDDHRCLDSKKRPGGRAHLKECFETLKKNIPNVDEKKTSNLSVLRSALRYIQTLKRKEKEYEHEMERLAREKISMQQRLSELKNELSQWMDVLEMDRVMCQNAQPEDDQASTSTASEGEDNMDEDADQEGLSTPGSRPKAPHALPPETWTPQLTPRVPDPSQPPLPPAPAGSAPAQPSAASLSPTPAQAPATLPQQPQAHTHVVAAAGVIAHASVIQAVNHAGLAGAKHVAPSPSSPALLPHGPQPVGHIAVRPVAHQPLPTLYSQPAAMARALSHGHVNGASTPSAQATALVAKQTSQVVTHHSQLVGQTVLNPVTMVGLPAFPVSTLKLA